MSTHGTILIKDTQEDGNILVRTYHDGNTPNAIAMICSLPRMIARRGWYASVIEDHEEKPLNRKRIVDFAERQGDFGYLYMLGVAHDMVQYHYDRWNIIPYEFKSHLAEYELEDEHHLKVQLNPFLWSDDKLFDYEVDSGILIRTSYDEVKNNIVAYTGEGKKTPVTLAQWIDKINSRLTDEAKINVYWNNVETAWPRDIMSGIFIPYYDRLIDETLFEAKRLRRKRNNQQ